VRTRAAPKTDGLSGRAALELATRVMESIREHAERVQPISPETSGKASR
jgi:dihydroorotate dehydrogenase